MKTKNKNKNKKPNKNPKQMVVILYMLIFYASYSQIYFGHACMWEYVVTYCQNIFEIKCGFLSVYLTRFAKYDVACQTGSVLLRCINNRFQMRYRCVILMYVCLQWIISLTLQIE